MDEIRIYIADQRGESVVEAGVVRSTLNYGTYTAPQRQAIDILEHINEWEVDADQGVALFAQADTVTVLIPLLDGILIEVDGKEQEVLVGNVFVWKAQKSQPLRVKAIVGYAGVLAFQELVFRATVADEPVGAKYKLPIIDPESKNNMMAVVNDSSLPFQLFVGAFLGKSEFNLVASAHRHYFAIALDGNFEVEERLLFTGDGLALKNQTQLNIECLSATGILLVLHF